MKLLIFTVVFIVYLGLFIYWFLGNIVKKRDDTFIDYLMYSFFFPIIAIIYLIEIIYQNYKKIKNLFK